VLRAPWCGLSLADLCALGPRGIVWDAMNDATKLAGLSADGQARLARTRDVFAYCLAERMRAGLRQSVEGAWLALGGPACVESDTELEDATVFLDFLEVNEDAGAISDPESFERRLEKLYAVPDLEADDTLQVMTVHKAKGLEFDTVIVPGLGAGTDREERKLFLWLNRRDATEERSEFLMAPVNPTGSEEDEIYEYIRRSDKAHAEHESGRVMYVAATRARSALHLCGDARIGKTGAQPNGGSLLKRLWPVVQESFVPDPQARREWQPSRGAAPQLLRRLAMPRSPVSIPPAVAWAAPPEDAVQPMAIEFSWVGEAARRIGSVAHRWLQRIAEEGLEKWNAERVRGLAKVIRANLAASGVGAADLDAAAQGVERALVNAVEDERGRWILGPHPETHNEHRLTSTGGGARRQLVIDRHFVEADGTRWVIDYKTSRHEGADAEGFLDRERERYRPQLARYAALFPTAPKQGLYFPLMPGWRDCG
jgi:ATP-dependent exoDNAse (exonuclease V) beta subunit